jgi:predicted AlkP superfamily phosphohydrolase/phosphomutase
VFAETHCVGHSCWHHHDPTHPDHDAASAASVGDMVEHVYRDVDTRLAELIAAAGEDTTVVVFSLLGMGPNYSGVHLLEEVLERLDASAGRTPPATSRLARWLKARTPNPLRRFVPKKVSHVTRRATAGTRRCWVLQTDLPASAVRINLAGREPWGAVAPGPELDAFRDELRRELLACRDPDTGAAVVRDVVFTKEVHPGPASDALADALVIWDTSRPITALESPRIGLVRGAPPAARTGNHRDGGWLVVAGPGSAPPVLDRPVSLVEFESLVASLLTNVSRV